MWIKLCCQTGSFVSDKNLVNILVADVGIFDVNRAVHRNISIVKPTVCTDVSNLFYFGMTLYMFRTVFPSIIRSSRLYIQQQAYVRQILLSVTIRSSRLYIQQQAYVRQILLTAG